MSNPIPVKDRAAFKAHMDEAARLAPVDDDDGGSSAYHYMLDQAEEFMIKKRYLRGDPCTALRYYKGQ